MPCKGVLSLEYGQEIIVLSSNPADRQKAIKYHRCEVKESYLLKTCQEMIVPSLYLTDKQKVVSTSIKYKVKNVKKLLHFA